MDILLATLLSCNEAEGLISKVAPSDPVRTELIEVLKGSTEKGCEWDASSTEGTGLQSLLLWSNTMAKVTYRGVSYATDTRKQAANTTQVQETYRGVKFKKELASA